MKKIIFPILSIVAFTCVMNAQNINVSGNITTNTIWDAASIDTVKIIGNTTIDSTVVLTIEPGIVIDFTNDYFFNVKGRLLAEGTVTDTIVFTTSDTTGFYNNTHNGWSGIRIHDRRYSSDTIKIDYCKIEYGKADGSSGLENANDGGGLYTYSNFKLKIAHTTFKNNYAAGKGGAIYDYYSFVIQDSYYDMIGCLFNNNTSVDDGGAIFSSRSVLNIYEGQFLNNTSTTGVGGAIKDGDSNLSNFNIYNSRFSYNKAEGGGAIFCQSDNSGYKNNIKFCFFNNNEAFNGNGGALFVFGKTVDIQNSVIVNNEASSSGGGAYFYQVFSTVINSSSMFANNTIANNKALSGGGLYSFDNQSGADLFLNKIIFYNNETTTAGENDDVMFFSQLSENKPRVYTSSFTNDLNNAGAWVGNIFTYGVLLNTNPNFNIPSSGTGVNFEGYIGKDWSLNCNSPCTNPTGTTLYIPDSLDYRGSPRMINDTIDIGAYESYGYLTQPQNLTICEGDTSVFSSSYYAPTVNLPNSWWMMSQDNGLSWFSTVNYSGDWTLSTNTQNSLNGNLITLLMDFGCGYVSSDTVTLTVNSNAFIQQTKVACDSYFVGEALQMTSGVYYDTLNTSFGCDSVVETTLTINSSYFNSSTIDICQGDSALVFGNYEMIDSLYTDSLQTTTGCDSVYHVQLNVHPVYLVNQTAVICSNDSLFVAGYWQNTSNIYYDTLQSVFSCDSIIETTLTVNAVSSSVVDTSFCVGSSVNVGGTTYNQAGTYFQNYTNALNCDSLVTYNITENPLPNANIGPDTLLVCDGEALGFGLDDTTNITNYTIGNFYTLATNDSLNFIYDAFNAPTSVVSQVTDINGCVNNDQVILQNNAIQYLQIGVPNFYDPFLDFTIANMPSNVDFWYWSFGDGDTLSGNTNPTHEYTSNGSYQACLIGVNACGVDSSCMTFDIFTVGIKEETNSFQFTVYPNPVNDVLFINSEGAKIEYISITNIAGKIIKIIKGNRSQINVLDLPKGLYLLQIKTEQGIAAKRFIKE